YKLAAAAKIPGMKVGGSWRFDRATITLWLTNQTAADIAANDGADVLSEQSAETPLPNAHYSPQQGTFFAHRITLEGTGEDALAQSLSTARVDMNPHQVDAALFALASPLSKGVLLADEVGLGKTVEACLILNRLVNTGRAERVLVVAPRSLVVQWLGELWRKFHQVFVLVDRDRREDVRRENGPGFNPFDVHPRAIVALEDLVAEPAVARLAEQARPDLLVVDEAHRLRRRRGTEGSPEYRTVAAIAKSARHALLLSATPLEADAHGFFRLLELLHPERYDSWEEFQRRLEVGEPLHPCTSSTTRDDVGGFPPRLPAPVELEEDPLRQERERETLSAPAENEAQRRERSTLFAKVLSAPSGPDDPRTLWLGREAKRWDRRGEKSLVFVAERESLIALKKELEFRTSRRIGVFHEDLSPAQRDLEVARFAEEGGPNLLIATESGGEGRNFQFAKRLVMYDLPWDPVVVEQRIGRLDRISRRGPVEIVYFRPAGGFGADVVRLHEALGIFREPLGGLDRALGHVVEAVQRALDTAGGNLDVDSVVHETRELREKVRRAVYHHLHADRYRPELAESILARVPEELEFWTRRVVLEACRQFGFEVEGKGGAARWYLEFGGEATVESLHGVPAGTRFLGTFDRAEAVAQEAIDFFSTGHPLVEAVLDELADGPRGRVTLIRLPEAGFDGTGVVALRKDGPRTVREAFDLEGRARPEWIPLAFDTKRKLVEVPGPLWDVPDWSERVGRVFRDHPGEWLAVAGIRFEA
ncbi:MAG: DEAD/DEAH box helicase family protein, partial [Gemmatimonadetes bacterium]|nr:DEAD/DEAH box helicase family protein [Gemmatimonadota bacterium]